MTILNITNGDSAVNIMKEAEIPGEFLPWRDVLHDGPVPGNISLTELSEIRAQFIIDNGWGNAQDIHNHFIERDQALQSYVNYEKIILWFEHDLYDQLQILQILDWFSEHYRVESQQGPLLTIICTEQYLGMTTPEQMQSLLQYEKPIIRDHLNLANTAWRAFRASTPEPWAAMLLQDTSLLPFLHDAIVRQLEEYPSITNGLSRTAQQALRIISAGETLPGRIFGRNQEAEQRIYMGDSSFWVILHQMLDSDPALLSLPQGIELTLPTNPQQQLSITPEGEAVLVGKRNWLDITKLDRWIGGVHLRPGNVWCWDAAVGVVRKVG